MKHSPILIAMILALAAAVVAAQEEKKPDTGVSAQGTGQGQATVQAGQGGATASGSAAGSANAAAGQSSANVENGTEIEATLTRPVDAGRARPGDQVTAKAAKDVLSGGKVVVPRGSKLIGRVTKAQPYGSGSAGGKSASELGIVFDRALLKGGREVAIHGSIAAIGAARSAGSEYGRQLDAGATGSGNMAGSAGGSGGGLAGTVGGTIGGVANATTGASGSASSVLSGTAGMAGKSAGAVGGLDASGALKSGSRGVFGYRDLDIASSATGEAGAAVVTSTKRNVRLDSGTQMLLVAGGSTSQQSPAAPKEKVKEPKDKS